MPKGLSLTKNQKLKTNQRYLKFQIKEQGARSKKQEFTTTAKATEKIAPQASARRRAARTRRLPISTPGAPAAAKGSGHPGRRHGRPFLRALRLR